MSDILEDDMAYQITVGVIFNAPEFHVQISALENSGVSCLPPRNISEDDRQHRNNAGGQCRNYLVVRPYRLGKFMPVHAVLDEFYEM
jgi:hypothetical protein